MHGFTVARWRGPGTGLLRRRSPARSAAAAAAASDSVRAALADAVTDR